ncbi:metal ABC transporter permease [Labrenzia sp. OB1]|uniref:metal ABC transporter permease n=1 Tax=Labrenzia sp. OB1 TaxID=1561204 RepID=UPI0007B229EC|nr:metal ABC transporter permease [Labrenzia sp. OB1]KZM52046.1 zinc ABC transporter permease [Labrenzia sp. OB1]
MLSTFLDALTLQAGYNAALVAVGATLLGVAGGCAGCFLFLRKRTLVSDAVAHATLPGVCIAFILMVFLGGDGRNLVGLLIGSAATAGLGLLTVDWITRKTRLSEDAAIGAVLSVFFGLGVVLLTVIQTLSHGKQAGLEGFLLGSTAGMLFQDAVIIAVGGAVSTAIILVLRRPMTLVAFDPEYAGATGVPVRFIDIAMMSVVMMVTVVGLKLVGLILIVSSLIIPSVSARFWTDRSDRLLVIAAATGGLAGYLGTAVSATAPNLPTGPIIVLVNFAFFSISMLLSPKRGVLAAFLRHRKFQVDVHLHQGLTSLARGEAIREPLTRKMMRSAGYIREDLVATGKGRAAAAKTVLDEARWAKARQIIQDEAIFASYDGLTPIEAVLTRDQIRDIDAALGAPAPLVSPAGG